jgi:hypothetical protein
MSTFLRCSVAILCKEFIHFEVSPSHLFLLDPAIIPLRKCRRIRRESQQVKAVVEVRFRWERSFDRSYCHKNVGTDGNPFQNSKTYHHQSRGCVSISWCYFLLPLYGIPAFSFYPSNDKRMRTPIDGGNGYWPKPNCSKNSKRPRCPSGADPGFALICITWYPSLVYAGHCGNSGLFGSPVFAKLVQ